LILIVLRVIAAVESKCTTRSVLNWASGIGYRLHSLAAAQNQAQPFLLNPSSSWYNPLNNNDKPAQEDDES
jgi:hypothetical protein